MLVNIASLDPRTKLLASVMLIVATLFTEEMLFLLGICGFFLLVFAISNTPVRQYLRNLMLLSWLLSVTFLIHLLAKRAVSSDGMVLLTSQAIEAGIIAVGKLSLIVGWVTILSTSASSLEIVNGLEQLFYPLQRSGFPVQKWSMIAMLSIRFIPIVFEEGRHLHQACMARGLTGNCGALLTRLKNIVLFCIPLFSSMIRRVEHVTAAMENKAFQIGAPRSSLVQFRMKTGDVVVLGVSGGIMLWCILFKSM